MNEKIYKTMGGAGVCAIVTGIVILTIGLIAGVLMIVSGGSLISERRDILI